jgi:phage protein D
MPDVTYTLLVDGNPAPPEVLGAIQQLQVEDHARLADMLRLRVLLGLRENGSGWRVLDDELFPRLSRIEVKVRIGTGDAIPLIQAHVIESHARFSNEPGASALDVVAMDPTVLLNLDEKVRAWPNMSDSDIASAIFGEYGFDTDVESTAVSYDEDNVTTIQRGTDMQFLRQLARRNGCEAFVELNEQSGQLEGHFHRPRVEETPQGTLSINLGAETNVDLFSARHEMLRPATAAGNALASDNHEPQNGEAQDSSVRTLGRGTTQPADRPRRVLLSQTGSTSAAELQSYAQSVVDDAAFAIRAEGELNTVSYGGLLRAKRSVNVRGAGGQLSGVYYVEKVLHTFGSEGYTQKFFLRRNALGLQGGENFAQDTALPE